MKELEALQEWLDRVIDKHAGRVEEYPYRYARRELAPLRAAVEKLEARLALAEAVADLVSYSSTDRDVWTKVVAAVDAYRAGKEDA